jgi:hypothetical protein
MLRVQLRLPSFERRSDIASRGKVVHPNADPGPGCKIVAEHHVGVGVRVTVVAVTGNAKPATTTRGQAF